MDTTSTAHEIVECRVCGKVDWQEVVSFGPVPLANGFLDPAESYEGESYYPLGVRSCRCCRLMSLTHVVDPEVLFRSYLYVTSDSETMTQHMHYVAKVCCERFGLDRDSFVVEIGSNTGAQLMAFRDAGIRTLGVDPARNIATVANESGIETLSEFFTVETAESIARMYGSAQLILGRHVFAHIDDVSGVVAGVRALLGPAGVFAIEVPYALDLLDQTAFDTIYHEHLSYFTVRSLVALFARYGLRVLDIERLSVHGGSILVFVGLDEGPWKAHSSVEGLLELEERSGLDNDAVYQTFAEEVARIQVELPSLVRQLSADGQRIAGYGAPAKGNTILNVCGLGLGDLEFCMDNTELKQNKVLPGTHIPVRSPTHAKAHEPDYYLLLAWNYAEEIIRKELAFLESGGKFIRPIPRPTIVSADSLQVYA